MYLLTYLPTYLLLMSLMPQSFVRHDDSNYDSVWVAGWPRGANVRCTQWSCGYVRNVRSWLATDAVNRERMALYDAASGMETRCRAVSFGRVSVCCFCSRTMNRDREDANSLIARRHKSADTVDLPVVANLLYALNVPVQLIKKPTIKLAYL